MIKANAEKERERVAYIGSKINDGVTCESRWTKAKAKKDWLGIFATWGERKGP